MLSKGKEAYEKGQDVIGTAKAYNSLKDVQKQAKEVGKDKFATGAEYIQNLKGNLSPETQLSGVSDFTTAMVRLISRIAKKDGNLDAIRSNPGALQHELNACGVSYSELKLDEQAALQHLPRIASEGGATSLYLKEAWPGIVDQGEESAKGWTAKVKNFVKNDPVATAAIVLTAVAVGYVGWKLFNKFLSGKKTEKASGKKDEKGGMSFGTKMLLGAGLATVAAFGGKALVKKILAMMGKEDIAELLEKGEDLPEETRKLLEDQREMLEKQEVKLDEMRAEMTEKGRTAKGAVAGTVAGAVAGAKDKVGGAVENIRNTTSGSVEILKNPKQQFNIAVSLFVAGYFYEWVFDDANMKNNANSTIKSLRNIPIHDLISVYKNAEANGKTNISPSKIPIDNSKIKIGDKELFLTLQKLSELYLLFGKNEKINTVEDLFLFAYKSPAFRTSANVFASLKTKGLSGAMNDFGDDFDSKFDKMKYHVVDSLNEDFSTNLNKTDKKELRKIQAMLLVGASLSGDKDEAIDSIVSSMTKKPNQAVINEAKRFFEYVQSKSDITLAKIIDRYGVQDENINHLKDLLVPENLAFGRACLLISVTKGLNWEVEKSSAKDFSVITAVIGALPKNQRNNYISQLTSAFIEEDTNIKFPALKNLKPYFKKAYSIGIESLHKKGIGILQGLSSFKFLEGFCDLTGDALATIVGMCGITAEELNNTGSGHAFLALLNSKGVVIGYEKKNPVMLALSFGANTFFVKPVGILKETLSDLKDGDFEGAVKTWMYGSTGFITIGAVSGYMKARAGSKGWLTIPRARGALKGAAKWSLYPVYAPIWALGKIGKTGKFVYNVARAPGAAVIRANEYIRRPGRNLTAKMRTSMDKFRYVSLAPGQNVSNMLVNGRLLDDYYDASSYNTLSGAEVKRKLKYDKKSLLKRMASGFNKKMADEYAKRFMNNYNKFFEINDKTIDPKSVKDIFNRIAKCSANTENHRKTYDEIIKMVKGQKPNVTLRDKITNKLIKTGLFEAEAHALADQMVDKKSVERIFDRLKRGAVHSSHTRISTTADTKPKTIKAPEKQKNVLDEIKKIDNKIRQDKRNFSKKRRALAKKYKNMSDLSVRAKYESELRTLGEKMDITKQFKRRVKLTESLPKDVQKKNNVEIPDIKAVKGGKIKKVGKGLVGIAATIAAMYGASELISWAVGENEQLVLEDIYKDEIASSRNNAEKQSLEENKEIMKITVNYFSDIDAEYSELFNHFSPQKLKMMSERQLKTEVSKAVRSHKMMTRDIREFIANNLGSIEKFYKTFPDAQGEKNIGNIMALGFDKEGQKVELKYAGNDEFRTELWSKIDYVNENLDDLLAGKEPDSWGQIADSATYMIPVYGTARDAKDAYRHYGRGNYGDMAISGLWTVVGGVSDVLMVVGVGAIIKGGTTALRGAKVARAAGAATKTAKAAKTAKISKGASTITMGMMGADLFRPLFRPALDVKRVF